MLAVVAVVDTQQPVLLVVMVVVVVGEQQIRVTEQVVLPILEVVGAAQLVALVEVQITVAQAAAVS